MLLMKDPKGFYVPEYFWLSLNSHRSTFYNKAGGNEQDADRPVHFAASSLPLPRLVHLHSSPHLLPPLSPDQPASLQAPARYPHKDTILGLDLDLNTIKAAKNSCLLKSVAQRCEIYDRTYKTISFRKIVINPIEPKVLNTVFATESERFVVTPLPYPPVHPLVRKGIFTTDGRDYWARSRALRKVAVPVSEQKMEAGDKNCA